jgi:hypothetical protein
MPLGTHQRGVKFARASILLVVNSLALVEEQTLSLQWDMGYGGQRLRQQSGLPPVVLVPGVLEEIQKQPLLLDGQPEIWTHFNTCKMVRV